MDMNLLYGRFVFLDYNISHKLLLLRNNDSHEYSEPNTDLIFESVFYIDLPTSLQDIRILEASDEEVERIEKKIGQTIHKEFGLKVYSIESSQSRFYVGCSRFIIKKNNLPFIESSIV